MPVFKPVSRRFGTPLEVSSVSVRHLYTECPYMCIAVVLPEKTAKVFDLFPHKRRKRKIFTFAGTQVYRFSDETTRVMAEYMRRERNA